VYQFLHWRFRNIDSRESNAYNSSSRPTALYGTLSFKAGKYLAAAFENKLKMFFLYLHDHKQAHGKKQ